MEGGRARHALPRNSAGRIPGILTGPVGPLCPLPPSGAAPARLLPLPSAPASSGAPAAEFGVGMGSGTGRDIGNESGYWELPLEGFPQG